MRFFAVGGTGVNYYMWHGGTNFGRDAMYLQTTSYDFEAPIDEYGLPTTKSEHLGKLHRLLARHENLLLGATPQVNALQPAKEKQTLPPLATYRFAKDGQALVFVINSTAEKQTVPVAQLNVTLPPRAAAAVLETSGAARLLFESQYTPGTVRITRTWKPAAAGLAFQELAEPLPDTLPKDARETFALAAPVSMLPYTHDLTDYAFYQTTITSEKARKATLTLPMVRDFSTLFVNGKFVGTQPARLNEDRPKHWKHEYKVRLQAGENRLTVLAAALGLIKGDWMLDAPMSDEKKGLIGDVLLDGEVQKLAWTVDVGLAGERARLYDPRPGALAKWTAPRSRGRLRWFRAEFGAVEPNALGYALDIGKLFKGLIWLNGKCAGRYWQVPVGESVVAAWQHEFLTVGPAGEPVQRYYHLPLDWFRAHNTLVIFEETEAAPEGVVLVERV
jgi:beta-galactosidase